MDLHTPSTFLRTMRRPSPELRITDDDIIIEVEPTLPTNTRAVQVALRKALYRQFILTLRVPLCSKAAQSG